MQNLLEPLSFAGHLASIRASGTNLSGHVLKSCLREVHVNGADYGRYCAVPLQRTLQVLELADNRIHRIEGIPANDNVSLANNSETFLNVKALREALGNNVQVDLTATKISNTDDVATLFHEGFLHRTEQLTQSDRLKGFACYDITSTSLRVSPSSFWPQGLCACSEGFEGNGTSCKQCHPNTYNEHFNRSCAPCPSNSTAIAGATSVFSCVCTVGRTSRGALEPLYVYMFLGLGGAPSCNSIYIPTPRPVFHRRMHLSKSGSGQDCQCDASKALHKTLGRIAR